MTESKPVTQLLRAWRSGNKDALDRLIEVVYEELHRLAERYMNGERKDHTLQATALVNEAYLRLVDSGIDWQDRAHFFAVAASIMRRILVDHARALGRKKRAGHKVTLEESAVLSADRSAELLAVDDALSALAVNDPRAARVIEMFYFGGLKYSEIAEAMSISEATVDRDLRFGKSWLLKEIKDVG